MKKIFEKPELEVLLFADEDIIVTSTDGSWGNGQGQEGDDWIHNN